MKLLKKYWINLRERWEPPYHTEWVEDLPENISKRTVYIIGGRKHPFYAAVTCPRPECEYIVHLGVSNQFDRDNRWIISEKKDGSISLFPSVYVTGLKCRCHYWLRNGKIKWCKHPSLKVPEENKNKIK